MYYTTPIYLFRMKCHLCNNHFEIKVGNPIILQQGIIFWVSPIVGLLILLCPLMSWFCTNNALTIFLKTDPANLDYEITSGARRQEKRFKAEENGTVIPDEKVYT